MWTLLAVYYIFVRFYNFFRIKFNTNPYIFDAAILAELSKREPGHPVDLSPGTATAATKAWQETWTCDDSG